MGKPYVVSLAVAVQLLFCCALMSVSAQSPAPKPREFKWDVEYIMWAPDCKQSVMIGINGKFPGPNISANAGDKIKVEVTNKLHTEGVVIHWHGIRQIGTPWADGTASISQCPINPGETFTYEFTADKPGTFFYHGHYGMQRAAGLYGSLIVNATPQQPEPFAVADEYKYDDELSMLLSDWYREDVIAQAAGLDGKGKHWKWVDEPQTILINGRGQFGCSLGGRGAPTCDRKKQDTLSLCDETGDHYDKDRCQPLLRSECGPFCERSLCSPVVFNVDPRKKYRLRIASTTSLSALNVQVQGHMMTVVEADGNSVKPFVVSDIDIYSGESYSVILKTDQQPASSYWITVGVRGREPKTPQALAILNYTDSKQDSWPKGKPPETPTWNDVERSKKFTNKILAANGTPRPPQKPADRLITMLNTQNEVEGRVKWAINHVSLSLPATPYLGAYFYGIENIVFDTSTESPDTYDRRYDAMKPPDEQAAEAKIPTTVSDRVFRIPHGAVVDVVLQNANVLMKGVSESHPWHLHGHDFWVLGYNKGKEDAIYNHDRDFKMLNTENPPLRNTVVLFPYGWTVIRFVADNPGVWAFHCHIEPHLHLGMGVIFAEGMEKVRELNVPREAITCGRAKTAAVRPLPPAVAPPHAPAGVPSPP